EPGHGQYPGHQLKTVGRGLNHCRDAPLAPEPVENFFVIAGALDVGTQLADHAIGVRAAYVVALEQHLRAAAAAHDLAAQILVSGFLIIGPHEQHHETGKEQQPGQPSHFPAPAGCIPWSSMAAMGTALGTWAVTRSALGTSARPVPKVMVNTPIHTHDTSGFTKALMMGWPLSGFLPS